MLFSGKSDSLLAEADHVKEADEIFLLGCDEEEFFQAFKSESGSQLETYVNACLRLGRFVNSSERQLEIATKATEALKRIAAESTLNKLRVRKYGIKVDD